MARLHPLTTFFLVVFFTNAVTARTSCKINLNSFRSSEEPLFLKAKSAEILYPVNGSIIEVQGGDELRVYCGAKNFKFLTEHSEDTLQIKCINGNKFRILSTQSSTWDFSNPEFIESSIPELIDPSNPDPMEPSNLGLADSRLRSSKIVDGKNLACRFPARSAVQTGQVCGLLKLDNKYRMYNIGFSVGSNFISLITVCFNTELKSVLWSEHSVAPNVQYHMSKVPRIKFIQDREPYGTQLNMEHLYTRNVQIDTVARLLNSQDLAERYIKNNDRSLAYFARGHLAPKGDFVYAGEQLATFHFINVAPQWQYFNGGQWEKIESSLRNHVIQTNAKANILTLTLGNTQLEDENDDDIDIYLSYNETKKEKLVKVPKLYVKYVMFEPKASKDNVVIVGVNQPYENYVKMTTNDVICEDVCDRYPWLTNISQDNDLHHSAGYIYCCTPTDFVNYLTSARGHMIEFSQQNEFNVHADSQYSDLDRLNDMLTNEELFGEVDNAHATTFMGKLNY